MGEYVEIKKLKTDVLIIGGGAAGCYAALTISENSDYNVVILEKANIKRSGCLAAGVNALNAYIVKGRKPQDYVDYAKNDAHGIAREDLLLSMSERLNKVTKKLEDLGLVILKDENGEYVARGNRNIKINGENIKPILADAVKESKNVDIFNNVNVIDYIVKDNKIGGAYGISTHEEVLYVIEADAVICATGGVSGLYKPNNPGFSRHKMWYSPFNTGAGYAMGIRAGAEMTTFEMRFIALRCKDTISPTGTIAQGVGAPQVNALGEEYQYKYGNTTSERVYGTIRENAEGRGPCYLKTEGIDDKCEQDLLKAYLNMSPAQTLKWVETKKGPSKENVEIEGSEPYIVGGHTASGYWIDDNRKTTIEGLYAAGDVAGGCPQKYVTGALAEGEISGKAVIEFLKDVKGSKQDEFLKDALSEEVVNNKLKYVESFMLNSDYIYKVSDIEEAMQKVMDAYAGGISKNYRYTENSLNLAKEKIKNLEDLSNKLKAHDIHELLKIFEVKEQLTVCLSVIEHLKARKETRWNGFGEYLDYPERNDDYLKYVNSKLEDGEIKIIYRDLISNVHEGGTRA